MPEYKDIAELKKHIEDFKKSDCAKTLPSGFMLGYACAVSVFERILADAPAMEEGAE